MINQKQTLPFLAVGFLMLTGCQNATPDHAETPPTPPTSPAEAAAPRSVDHLKAKPSATVQTTTTVARPSGDEHAAVRSAPRDCLFVVDGKTLLDGPCLVFPMGNHGYTLNAWGDGKPRQSHFAVVIAKADGTGEVSWNADPDDDRAADSLGSVKLENGCWTNGRVRICAR